MAKIVKRKCPACNETKEFRTDQKTCGCKGNRALVAPAPKPPKPPKPLVVENDEINGKERRLTKVVFERIQTLEQLAKVCEIDTEIWEIYKWRCTAWQTGMKPPTVGSTKKGWTRKSDEPIYSQQYAVSAEMRLKENVIFAKNELEQLRKEAVLHVPAPAIIKLPGDAHQVMQEYGLYDHHFGGLIWGKETLNAPYDRVIADKNWDDASDALISRNSFYKAKRAILVIGNDQQNIDNRAGATEQGTPQHSDSRYQKIFTLSKSATIRLVDKLLGRHEEVHVVSCPGNHDYLATWHLADSLQSWYRDNSRVTIDNSPAFRKYRQHGIVMLMWTHGNKGKLEDYDQTMAAEAPQMWGSTLWREAHTGDKHQRRLIELKGAAVRIMPSLRPPCAWSSENHLIGAIRAAESYTWHAEEGLINVATFSILNKREAA